MQTISLLVSLFIESGALSSFHRSIFAESLTQHKVVAFSVVHKQIEFEQSAHDVQNMTTHYP